MSYLYIYRLMSAPVRGAARSTSETVASFRPRSVPCSSGPLRPFVVEAARPDRPSRAKALLFATSKLAAFGISVGLDLSRGGGGLFYVFRLSARAEKISPTCTV